MISLISALQLRKQESILPNLSLPLTRSDYLWSGVKGMTSSVEILETHVIRPVKESNGKNKIIPVKTMLFHGLHGTGKTYLSKSLASELKRLYWDHHWTRLETFYINSAELTSTTIDETKSRLTQVFRRVLDHKPCLLILDDLDILFKCVQNPGSSKLTTSLQSTPLPSNGDHQNLDYHSMLIAHLQNCIDKLRGEPVYLILITNSNLYLQPQDLFTTRRPDLTLPFYPLDLEGREKFVKFSASKFSTTFTPSILNSIVQQTDGYTPVDFVKLENLTLIEASCRHRKNNDKDSRNKKILKLQQQDFLAAVQSFQKSNCHAESCFRTLDSVPSHMDPLFHENVKDILNILQSKVQGFPSNNFSNDASKPVQFLYMWNPKSSKVPQDFVHKYIVPSVLHEFPHLPVFIISEEIIQEASGKEFSSSIVIRMIREVQNFGKPCFLLLQNLHWISAKCKGDMRSICAELLNGSNYFVLATSLTDQDKMSACLQEIFHGFQGTFKIRKTGQAQVANFIGQAFAKGQLSEEEENIHQNEERSSPQKLEESKVGKTPNPGALQLFRKSEQRKSLGQGSHDSRDSRPDDRDKNEEEEEEIVDHYSNSNFFNQEEEKDEEPSRKIPRIETNVEDEDADFILERSLTVASRISMKFLIWFYEDLVRIRGRKNWNSGNVEDKREILRYQEDVVEEAEKIHKIGMTTQERKSSNNFLHSNGQNRMNSSVSDSGSEANWATEESDGEGEV